jgi:hypothetical protein
MICSAKDFHVDQYSKMAESSQYLVGVLVEVSNFIFLKFQYITKITKQTVNILQE